MRNCGLSILLKVGLALCVGMMLNQSVSAQCSNGLSTHTYDTTLTSNGFGLYSVTVPQWSPDSGTLVSVKISTTVSSQYGFTLRNADNNTATYNLTLGQEDQISGSALSSPFSSSTSQFVSSYPLTSGQSVTQAPFSFLDNRASSDSITGNIAPFLGMGQLTFNYMSFTFTNLTTVNNATYYYSANINNSMHFTVQYFYCTAANGGNMVLAANLTRFSAQLTAPHTTQISWAAVNETANRTYDIQRSTDSKNFQTIAFLPAQGNESGADYSYSDNLPDSITGNVYYRLQIHDQGNLNWSPVQMVNVAASTTTAAGSLRVFPNPASTYVNIATGGDADDWQVEIYAANGNLVQRLSVTNSNKIYIPFNSRLSAGTYFVKLLGLHGQRSLTTSFVVISGN